MYEYEERNNMSTIKEVIVQILLMVMFVFILICLFPTKGDLKNLEKGQGVSSLEPLYNRIFNENIIAMKDSAKSYYTTPRLPKNVGDTVSMTLAEMLEKKIILPFTDSEGKKCDLEKSYVSVTKESDEFVMKVNLKCSDQENYLLVVMGCYDYCETSICEKNTNDVTKPVVNPTTPVRPVVYYCKYVNGVYYGKNGNTVNQDTYNKECNTATKQYQCKYMKEIGSSYTAWSAWSDWTETKQTPNDLKEEKSQKVTQQRKEKQIIGYKTITYKDPNKPIYGPKQVLIGTRKETTCAEYGYVVTTTGKTSTNVTYGEWKSEGLVKLYSTPTSTNTVRYTKISVGTETCGDCGGKLYTIYKKETRTVSKSTSAATESSVYKCLRSETKEIPVYGTQNVIIDYGTSTKKEAVYGLVTVTRDVTLYSYRTRSVIAGSVDYKTSNCNNTDLLNNGYKIVDKWEV